MEVGEDDQLFEAENRKTKHETNPNDKNPNDKHLNALR